jgi:acyl-CoA thioesterase
MDKALAELLEVLNPQETGPGAFSAQSCAVGGREAVFGGQLLAQMVVCAARTVPDMTVKSLQVIFTRAAEFSQPLRFDVEVHHAGRLYAHTTVSVSQGERLCARAMVLLDRADTELARHGRTMPDVAGPDESATMGSIGGGMEARLVGGVDLSDPEATGPAELQVWARFPDAAVDDSVARGLLAFATEPYFFSAALRPHRGLGTSMSFVDIVPAVITHSVTFHEAVDVSEWFLLDLASPYLGRGRIYGEGSVYRGDGALVASMRQENQLRPLHPPAPS